VQIWPWLVQMGQGRGGMYSYDRLENVIGLDIHTTDEIRAEWLATRIGEPVTLVMTLRMLRGMRLRAERASAEERAGTLAPGGTGPSPVVGQEG
jgi:hypothetical protein